MKPITRTQDFSIISLEDEYEGYLWKSNAEDPVPFNGDKLIDHSIFDQIPFIIEGNLYSESAKVSYHIQNIDGQYWITKYDLSQLQEVEFDDKTYLGNSKVKSNYKMREAWEEVELTSGINTLEPSWSAFIGFTK